MHALFAILVIVLLDQFIWRPILALADKFLLVTSFVIFSIYGWIMI